MIDDQTRAIIDDLDALDALDDARIRAILDDLQREPERLRAILDVMGFPLAIVSATTCSNFSCGTSAMRW